MNRLEFSVTVINTVNSFEKAEILGNLEKMAIIK